MGCPTEQILTAVGCDGSAVGVLLAAGMLASLPGEGAGAGRWWKLWELLNVGFFWGKKGGRDLFSLAVVLYPSQGALLLGLCNCQLNAR